MRGVARRHRRELQAIAGYVNQIRYLGAPLGDLLDYVGIVLDVVEGDQEDGFDMLNSVDPLLPRLRLGVPQILSDLLELTKNTPSVLRIQNRLQKIPLAQGGLGACHVQGVVCASLKLLPLVPACGSRTR